MEKPEKSSGGDGFTQGKSKPSPEIQKTVQKGPETDKEDPGVERGK